MGYIWVHDCGACEGLYFTCWAELAILPVGAIFPVHSNFPGPSSPRGDLPFLIRILNDFSISWQFSQLMQILQLDLLQGSEYSILDPFSQQAVSYKFGAVIVNV